MRPTQRRITPIRCNFSLIDHQFNKWWRCVGKFSTKESSARHYSRSEAMKGKGRWWNHISRNSNYFFVIIINNYGGSLACCCCTYFESMLLRQSLIDSHFYFKNGGEWGSQRRLHIPSSFSVCSSVYLFVTFLQHCLSLCRWGIEYIAQEGM